MPRTGKADMAVGRNRRSRDEDESDTLQALLETLQSLRASDVPVRRLRGRLTAEIGAVPDGIEAAMEAKGLLKRSLPLAGGRRSRQRELWQANQHLARRAQQLAQRNAKLERHLAERAAELAQAHAELGRAREREAALVETHETQRMESLGRLADGVAHDFNNVLMVILGNLDLIALTLAGDTPARRLIDGAIQAAEHGATLTQRLLAFARRRELRPEAVDVARRIDGMLDMLRRSLGPRIEIGVAFGEDLAPVRVDPGQLDLAILDLAFNARDAMPQGGRLTIAARRAAVAADQVPPLAAGDYVAIVVGDDGAGRDEVAPRHAPEPFHATKDAGMATGPGLSMVYGLAAQSGGTVRLSSRVGAGTAIELWLPVAFIGEARAPHARRPPVDELSRALACAARG